MFICHEGIKGGHPHAVFQTPTWVYQRGGFMPSAFTKFFHQGSTLNYLSLIALWRFLDRWPQWLATSHLKKKKRLILNPHRKRRINYHTVNCKWVKNKNMLVFVTYMDAAYMLQIHKCLTDRLLHHILFRYTWHSVAQSWPWMIMSLPESSNVKVFFLQKHFTDNNKTIRSVSFSRPYSTFHQYVLRVHILYRDTSNCRKHQLSALMMST